MLATAVALSIVALLYAWVDRPEIHERSVTGECVRVISPDPTHSCTNLPKNANVIQVR